MKTLTATHYNGWTCSYRNRILLNVSLMTMVECWAKLHGYTHVKWIGISIGKGTTISKV